MGETRVIEEPCPDDDRLTSFVQGAVDADERARVEHHLDGCPTCRELLATLAETFAPASLPTGPPAPLSLGSVGRYELLDVIGRGGMGVVYEARDPVLGRRLALKVMRNDRPAGSPEARAETERLLREARAMARVTHPNVVGVYDAGVDGGRVYVAMDLVRGSSLRGHLREHRGLDGNGTLRILRGVAAGIAAAHGAGVVHRDLKPENVVVGPEAARVVDFGLARPAVSAGETAPVSADAPWFVGAATDGIHGTPAYMSPEQIDGAGQIGPASDQFAFAVMAYEVIYGSHPFGLGDGDGAVSTLGDLRRRIDRGPDRPGRSRRPPLWLWPIVERALAPRPEDRWPGMASMAAALDGPDEPTRRTLSRLALSLVLMCIVHVLLLLLIVVSALLPDSGPPDPPPSPLEIATLVLASTWLLMGPVMSAAGAAGLVLHRRWSYGLIAAYAALCVPTFVGTPFAAFAIYALARRSVRRALGRRT